MPPLLVVAVAENAIAVLLLVLTDRLCADGNAPRLVKLKVSDPGNTLSVGCAATTKVTGMTTGELDAPVDASVIVPVYVLAARLPGETETVMPVGVVAVAGVTVSQLPPPDVAAVAV